MTHRIARPAGLAAIIALSLGLALTACSDDASDDATENVPTDASPAASGATDATDAPADDATEGTSDDAPEGTDDGGSDDATGPEGIGDRTTTALAALATAEAEAGGTAFAIDDDDTATSWEVDVAVDDGTVEVAVDGTGTEVLSTTEDDLDAEDRDALDGAKVGLAEAIQRVVGQSGGTLEDAELDVDDGAAGWNVAVLTTAGDEEEYLVDLGDGSVTPGD